MPIIGTLPNNIQNGQTVDAAPLMADFNFIVNQVNANAQPSGTPPAGTLLAVRSFTGTTVYTPTVGTNAIVAILVGGGAAGGGAAATNASQVSVGAGGNSGGMCVGRFASGFSGQTITIGAGGTPLSGGGGGNGANSTFLALTATGGAGGGVSGAVSTTLSANAFALSAGTVSSGGVLNTGQSIGGTSLFVQNQGAVIGFGGDSPLGGGGGNGILNGTGGSGTTAGAGGGGTANGPSQGNQTGGGGSNGICVIYEYS
jgi:hypothetical protein